MKTVTFRTLITFTFALFLTVPAMSQKGVEDGSKYGHGQDSVNCLMNLSLYKEYFKHGNYDDAINSWRKVFNECPASSLKMYVEGVSMYKKFMSQAKDPATKDAFLDTVMMVYDQRLKYFDDEANVLGRKAADLLRYRKTIEAIEEGYGYLHRSVELDPAKARDAILIMYVNTSVSLYNAGKLEQNTCIDDYFTASALIDAQMAKSSSSRWTRAKKNIDDLMLKEGPLTCESLNDYYGPKFEANKDNEEFLNKVTEFYYAIGCDKSDIYAKASEQLYAVNPTADAAYKLARLFYTKNEYEKATSYYLEATNGDAKAEDKAKYYLELAKVTWALGEACKAIEYAKESVKLNDKLGEAYLLLGDLYIDSRKNLGDDFEEKTAFWAAADKYIKAKNVDPTVSDDANKKINNYAGNYPNGEECFFRTLKDGDSYYVKGCINEYTTVRSRK